MLCRHNIVIPINRKADLRIYVNLTACPLTFAVLQFKVHGGHLTRHFITDILAPDSPLNLTLATKLAAEEAEDAADTGDKMKKPRTSFSGWQIYELEKLFEEKKYINNDERKNFSR